MTDEERDLLVAIAKQAAETRREQRDYFERTRPRDPGKAIAAERKLDALLAVWEGTAPAPLFDLSAVDNGIR